MTTAQPLRTSPIQLADLANGIAQDGFASHVAAAVALANLLHCEGFRQIALDIIRDDTQPAIARERAFGLIHRIALEAPRQLHSSAA